MHAVIKAATFACALWGTTSLQAGFGWLGCGLLPPPCWRPVCCPPPVVICPPSVVVCPPAMPVFPAPCAPVAPLTPPVVGLAMPLDCCLATPPLGAGALPSITTGLSSSDGTAQRLVPDPQPTPFPAAAAPTPAPNATAQAGQGAGWKKIPARNGPSEEGVQLQSYESFAFEAPPSGRPAPSAVIVGRGW